MQSGGLFECHGCNHKHSEGQKDSAWMYAGLCLGGAQMTLPTLLEEKESFFI